MGKRQKRWETMNKNDIPLERLAQHYLTTCRTEGKTLSTLRTYTEKIGRFIRWCEDGILGEFSIELMREYVEYLQTVPKYKDHPFHAVNGDHMSQTNVRNHVRVIKGFSTWLYEENYTDENVLQRLKVPKGTSKIMMTL